MSRLPTILAFSIISSCNTPGTKSGLLLDDSTGFRDAPIEGEIWDESHNVDDFEEKQYISLKSKTRDYINCVFEVFIPGIEPFKSAKISILRNKRLRYSLPEELKHISNGTKALLMPEECEFFRPDEPIASIRPDTGPLTENIHGILKYLKDTQVQESEGENKLEGEWGTLMRIRKGHLVLDLTVGPEGQEAYDSNCFATSTTLNTLGQMYLNDPRNPELQHIPAIADKAIKKVMQCKGDHGFGFWPMITTPKEWTDKLDKKGKTDYPRKIRGPKHFHYLYYWVQLQANVVDDADDTALSFLSLKIYDEIKRLRGEPNPFRAELPEDGKFGQIFEAYRNESKRKGPKGVFLTWFGEDSPRPFAIGEERRVIPLDYNVLDCVVVSNVLGSLARYNEIDSTEGVAESCKYVSDISKRRKEIADCGTYYPNRFNLHYVASKAYENKATCLEESKTNFLKDIEDNQLTDGSWNTFEVQNDDVYQSTAYALNAYLTFLEAKSFDQLTNRQQEVINRAVNFLLTTKLTNSDGHIFWPAGIQFSGGKLLGLNGVRNRVVFRARGFTNALILSSLYKIREMIASKR